MRNDIESLSLRVRARRGLMAEVVRQMGTLGVDCYRQECDSWLHPDPRQRIEPRLSVGLVLPQAVEAAEHVLDGRALLLGRPVSRGDARAKRLKPLLAACPPLPKPAVQDAIPRPARLC